MKKAGFTLIELMIVVAIISILAAIAIPEFNRFMVKSRRAEAYIGLGAMYNAQVSFKAQKEYFSISTAQVGLSMNGPPTAYNGQCLEGAFVACGKYYSFTIQVATVNTFVAQAWGNPDPSAGGDTFMVVYPSP